MTKHTYSILVADDEPEIVGALVTDLYKLGNSFGDTLSIFTANSATEALAVLAKHHVDVLFLDYYFEGGINGDEIIDRLEDPLRQKVVVFMSAKETELLQDIVTRRHQQLGTRFKFLRKPFDYLELQDKYFEIANFLSGYLDIKALIARGESRELEFKSSSRWDFKQQKHNKGLEDIIVKTIASFLNAEAGGILLIGVADDQTIIGLEWDYQLFAKSNRRDAYENFLTTLLLSNLGKDTSALISISFHEADGKEICKVQANASPKPVFVKSGNSEDFYIRAGNSTRLLTTKEALEYSKMRWK